MIWLRAVLLLALFGGSFAAAWHLLQRDREPDLPDAAEALGLQTDGAQSRANRHGVGAEARANAATAHGLPRRVEIGSEHLTEWQRLVRSEPEQAARTRDMVRAELHRYIASGEHHPARCLSNDVPVMGTYRFIFETHIISAPDRVTTSPWRFVRVLDGVPVAPDVSACMERFLSASFELEGPPGAETFLASYEGDLQVEVSVAGPAAPE